MLGADHTEERQKLEGEIQTGRDACYEEMHTGKDACWEIDSEEDP